MVAVGLVGSASPGGGPAAGGSLVGVAVGDDVGISSAGGPSDGGGVLLGAGAPGVPLAGGAGSSPTTTSPRTGPVTGAKPLRSGSSAARLQLTLRLPAFQDSSVMLSQ